MKNTIDEMIALHPKSADAQQLEFTACCRCCMCDSPMRSFLKQTKGHSGYWCCDRCIQEGTRIRNIISYTNTNSPLRMDEHFLDYHVNDFSKDEHINPSKISPFVRCNFPMVTGFSIDPLHTMIDGAFGKRIEGFARVTCTTARVTSHHLYLPLLTNAYKFISYLKQKNSIEQLKNQISGQA